jgi:transcriptional regulator with XRE-family HTH domain
MTLPESWRNVGNRIRYLRKANHLTLKQLSSGCDLSANTISLVERGEVAPSIETLCKIANALGVLPGSLFLEVCTPQVMLQRAVETESRTELAEKALQAMVCPTPDPVSIQSSMELNDFTQTVQGQVSSGRSSILCLCGQIEFEVDGQSYPLKPGDNLMFNSDAFHRLRNPGLSAGIAVLVLHPNLLPPFSTSD